MTVGWRAVLASAFTLVMVATPAWAAADVFSVPDSIRQMRGTHEDVHVLRALTGGASLGEQRFHASVDHDRLLLDIATHFTDGEQWDEHAEMDLAHGYRARSFYKVGRRNGAVVAEQHVDFTTGEVSWMHDGIQQTRSFTFTPDTFIGPMLGVVLADVPERAARAASLHSVVFRPDAEVYMLRAEVIDEENFRIGNASEPTTKVRLKADLGPVQNVMFASYIPTHYFWFTREDPPEFFAFEGTLGSGGPELRMIPQHPDASTAKVDRTDRATRAPR